MATPDTRQPRTFIIEGPEDHPDYDNTQDLHRDDFDPFNNRAIHHDGLDPVDTSLTLPLMEADEETIPTTSIIDNLLALKQYEEQRKMSMIEKTNKAWDLYHNRYTFSHKDEWQSKIATPKFSVAVERIVSALLRMLEDSDNWFDVEATEPESEIYFNLVEVLIKKFLDTEDLRFRKFFKEAVKTLALSQHVFVHVSPYVNGYKTIEMPKPDPANLFSTGSDAEPGLEALMGKPMEPKDTEDPTKVLPSKDNFHINLDTLNTDYCYKDSRNRDLHIIHEHFYTVGELKMEARERGWDMEMVEHAIKQGDPGTSRIGKDGISHDVRDADKQDVTVGKTYGKEAKVTYFYGTLLDEVSGDVLLEDHFFIMVNDCEIVYGPTPMNEVFWGGVRPIVESPFVSVPHAPYGKSPLVDAVPLFVAWNEFYNLMYDYYRMVILGIKEVDMDMIDEAEFDLADGIMPGQVIPVDRGMNPQGQAIKNVEFTDPPAGFFNFIQMFEKDLQDNIALSDTISGGARTRGRITALEHQRRAADAGALIESLYETLEENLLVQVIYKTFYAILQFMPDKDWKDFVETRYRSIAPKAVVCIIKRLDKSVSSSSRLEYSARWLTDRCRLRRLRL